MFERVLFVAPPSSSYLGAARPPSNLGYLAQSLLEAGIPYGVVDMRAGGQTAALRHKLREFRPDLIGVSMISLEYRRTYALIRQIKEERPSATIVVGGAHISALKAQVLDECPEIDLGIVGEAERALVSLCRGDAPPEAIPGLLFRREGAVQAGAPASPITDLDNIPFPRYIGFNLRQYAREAPLITSRGCPYRCIFCPNSLTAKRFRARSAGHVVEEMAYWHQRGIRQLVIDDDNFSLDKERVYAICDEIDRRGLKGLFIRCANGIRADRVDHDLLARMKSVGVHEVGFGADGGNDHVLLDIVHKGETIGTIEQAIRDALDVGIQVRLFVILGHPGETPKDIEDSMALARRYPLIRLHMNNPIPYPGTELYEWVKSHNAFRVQPEEYLNRVTEDVLEPVFETPELPAAARREILRRAARLERDVWCQATERMLPDWPGVIRQPVARLFATSLGQWLFFKNMLARSVINHVWYHKMTTS